MTNDLDNIIVLNDENGKEVKFEFLDLVEYAGEEYVVLLPVEESDEAGEVVILKFEETKNEDDDTYVSVDDEATFMAVLQIFKERFEEAFKFVD